ncbi:hypothetical protein HC891_04335 [Candidatus Gracilibacteria bacterium]|nr:hypothetical protein [Candidatus Gracilibacteria bacterium]
MDRPITQMVNNANTYLKNNAAIGNPEIFVIALSDVADTGLKDGVPTVPANHFEAKRLETYADGSTNVDAFIDLIHSKIVIDPCKETAENRWVGTYGPDQFGPMIRAFIFPRSAWQPYATIPAPSSTRI